MIEPLLFELLQVAIGSRPSLSVAPSAKEWLELFLLSKKQALAGICFVGVQKLFISQPSLTTNLTEHIRLQWLGLTAKIAQRNRTMNEECVRVAELLRHDGFHCCILKGRSNLSYYPEDLQECRTSGDIDVLFRSMEEPDALNLPIRYCQERARLLNKKAPHVTYHHADLAWEGQTEVEGHYRATFLCSPIRNLRLQHWLEENMPWDTSDVNIGDCVFPIPPVSYNAVYQLLHIYKHLFEEGIGLRQLLDYYFVLHALHIEQGEFFDRTQSMAQWAKGMGIAVKSNREIMHTLKRFGIVKFASAAMYVLQTVFAMPDEYLICKPNEKEGKFLLNEIMMGGNFGKYDERIARGSKSFMGFKVSGSFSHAIEKTKHNLRLLTHYPEEVLWDPFFRVYHLVWRKCELWKY